jgi:hypothetical protein
VVCLALLTACAPGSVSGRGLQPDDPADARLPARDGSTPTADAGIVVAIPPGATRLPCAVEEVVLRRCATCHASSPRFGAPMPLVTWDDFDRPSVTDASRRVIEIVPTRLSDTRAPMPPDMPLDPVDRGVLDAWLGAGGSARAATDVCEEPVTPPTDPVDPTDPTDPTVDPTDCTVTDSFLAYGGGDAAYRVPTDSSRGANVYRCFPFPSPFTAGEQAYGWTPVVDDERVLHHMVIFRVPRTYPAGESFDCFDMPEGAEIVAAWAPGGTPFELPDDVGLALPGAGESIVLQIHYWNVPGYTDALDRSGIAVCAGPQRPQTAAYLNAGTSSISIPPRTMGFELAGGCDGSVTRGLGRSVTAIAAFPHMHQLGRAITAVLARGGTGDGALETIVHVEPWSFDNQGLTALATPIRIDPGDAVGTRCVWDNPTSETVTFGERTEDEMCGTALLVYPLEESIMCF